MIHPQYGEGEVFSEWTDGVTTIIQYRFPNPPGAAHRLTGPMPTVTIRKDNDDEKD